MTDITSGIERWIAANARIDSAEFGWGNRHQVHAETQAAAKPTPEGNVHAAGASKNRPSSARPSLDHDEKAPEVCLGYEPFEKQQHFHASPAKYRLFGGAAGPGKTKALLMEAIMQAHETPGAHTLLLRRAFSELEQSLLLYFRRHVPRELYTSFNESKHLVTWRNGSTTRFGYCQNEQDGC